MARAVAGDRVKVEQYLEPGSDPHEYEPRPSDAQAVAGAKVVIRSGGEVDGWLRGLIDQAGGDAQVTTLIDHVARYDDDPHWWQDPRNAARATEAIREALTKADPEGAAVPSESDGIRAAPPRARRRHRHVRRQAPAGGTQARHEP